MQQVTEIKPKVSPLGGANVLLFGGSGVGKTHALRTLAAAGIETFIVMTDTHGRTVLNDVPDPMIHWHHIPPKTGTFEEMAGMIERSAGMSWDYLVKQYNDPNKKNYTGLLEVYQTLHSFTCDRCGKNYGDVSTWGTDRAIVLDHYSAINQMAMQVFSGLAVARQQGQWYAAMTAELMLAHKLCNDTRAHNVLIAHRERQVDEVIGGTHLVPLALGKKVAPDLPREYSDVILAEREGDKFYWSTAKPNADLKAIHLKIGDKLEPDFGQIIETWKAKGGVIAA